MIIGQFTKLKWNRHINLLLVTDAIYNKNYSLINNVPKQVKRPKSNNNGKIYLYMTWVTSITNI